MQVFLTAYDLFFNLIIFELRSVNSHNNFYSI